MFGCSLRRPHGRRTTHRALSGALTVSVMRCARLPAASSCLSWCLVGGKWRRSMSASSRLST